MENSLILVVDDDRRLRDLLVKFLKEKGFRVCSAHSAAEARAQLALNKVDLIVLDIMMPGESGLELTQNLRTTGSVIPILFLTAKDSVDEKIEAANIAAKYENGILAVTLPKKEEVKTAAKEITIA